MKNLNFGCFDQIIDGWLNTDITPHIVVAKVPLAARVLHGLGQMTDERFEQHQRGVFRRVRYVDLGKRFPFADGEFDNAFSAHVLEHLPKDVGERCIREVYRVLKPGGVVRVSVPDLDIGIAQYEARNPEAFLELVYNASQERSKNRHHWMYNEHSLRRLLEGAGFSQVTRCAFREGRCPDLDRIDNRPDVSLFMEGIR